MFPHPSKFHHMFSNIYVQGGIYLYLWCFTAINFVKAQLFFIRMLILIVQSVFSIHCEYHAVTNIKIWMRFNALLLYVWWSIFSFLQSNFLFMKMRKITLQVLTTCYIHLADLPRNICEPGASSRKLNTKDRK